jgi:hypothetical protein
MSFVVSVSGIATARAQTSPSAVAVLQAAGRTMDSVQSVRVKSVSNQTRNGLRARWTTTGVCDASRVTDRSPYMVWQHQLRARIWIRGWSQSSTGKRLSQSTHYVMLDGPTNSRLWVRATSTNDHWQRTPKEGWMSDVYTACAVLFPDATGITPDPALAQYQLVGQKSVRGIPAWNVLVTESGGDPRATTDTHWFVDAAGSRILAAHVSESGSATPCNTNKCKNVRFNGNVTESYSAFNQPVSIHPPRS